MSPEKRQEIEQAARAAVRAGENLQALAMQNTATDPKEGEEQVVRYALAKAEFYEAQSRAQRTIESV